MSEEIMTEATGQKILSQLKKIEDHLDQLVSMFNDAWDPCSHSIRTLVVTGGAVTPTVPPFTPHDPPGA